MKRVRSVLFWTHLAAGVLGGVVILVMSFTGVVLAFKPQIQNWVDRGVRYVEPRGEHLSAHALLTAVTAARPDANPESLMLDRDPSVAALVGLGQREGSLYVNPYSGAVLGPQSRATQQFFQSFTAWHRYLGMTGESRATGRSFTGASNLAFFLLGLSGLYLWWPKQLTAKHLRPILWFKSVSTGKARDFNWHNTIGFWCLVPILVMTASGVMMSYTWGNNLVYRLTGSPLPPQRGEGPRPGGAARPGGPGGPQRQGEQRGANRPAAESHVIPASLDRVFARAQQQVPTWGQLTLRLPHSAEEPVSFTIIDGAQWNSFARSQLTLNSTTGEVVQWQPYEGQNLGQKLRGWLRFAHTGELGGLAGQLVAGIGCLGGVFLVYTGFSLAIRRLWNWSIWRRAPRREAPGYGTPGTPATTRTPLMDES